MFLALPLPDPNTLLNSARSLAFPQIFAWCAAASGIYLFYLILKSFWQ